MTSPQQGWRERFYDKFGGVEYRPIHARNAIEAFIAEERAQAYEQGKKEGKEQLREEIFIQVDKIEYHISQISQSLDILKGL